MAEEAEPDKPEEEAGKPEDTAYANRISGMLWLDVLEDKDSGAYPGGRHRHLARGRTALAAYEVSLYKAEDKTTAVETVQTDSEGKYIFEQLEPGSYVVGISTCIKGDTEYLLPVAGITEDNQFADFNEDYTTVYSEEIPMEEDTVVVDINAGLRTPPGIVAASVGIQPSKDSGRSNLIEIMKKGDRMPNKMIGAYLSFTSWSSFIFIMNCSAAFEKT